MAEYRLYCIDGGGQIAGAPELVSAPSDDQAIAAVKARETPALCELWLGTRLVAVIPPADKD